jgi:hypothetical protein
MAVAARLTGKVIPANANTKNTGMVHPKFFGCANIKPIYEMVITAYKKYFFFIRFWRN